MNAYDPQARRARSRPAAVSPIDTLRGDVEASDESDSAAPPVGDVVAGVADDEVAEAPEATPGRPDGEVRPFEAPPIELADEHIDRLHRFGVLAAVAAVLLVLVALRKRRRSR